MPFLRCEAQQNGKIRFVFEDSASVGAQAELELDRGAVVTASNIFASQKYLRRMMSEALNTRRIGKSYEYTSRTE